LHAVLICRDVKADERGEISLLNVVEIIPTGSLPADVGPLCFVAFVRDLPGGPGNGAFLLRHPDGTALGRLPLEVNVPKGFEGRQLALHVKLAAMPIESGGWFEVAFEWEGAVLGTNRFAVGSRQGA
jgi:hypothetical protein